LAAGLLAAFPVAAQELEVGQELAYDQSPAAQRRRQARLFDEHVVRMGETAFSIARGYAISPLTLAADNPELEITRLRAGQVLLIRKRERGTTEPDQVAREWQQMMEASEAVASSESSEPEAQVEEPPLTPWGVPYLPEGGGVGSESAASLGSGLGVGSGLGRVPDATPNIALMLPLSDGGAGTGGANSANSDFTDLYRGALLALEDLRARGRSARVTLYDTARSPDKVRDAITSAEFVDTDLIIGPVFEDEMEQAVQFADFFDIPMVSPLAAVRRLESENVYQMAPDPASKYNKLRPLLAGDANIILVSSGAGDDAEFEREIVAELGARPFRRFVVGGAGGGSAAGSASSGEVSQMLDWERENVLIVLAASEAAVDRALATISSSYNNASARMSRRAAITVVGSSRWAGYGSLIDENLFFKLNTKFVTNYYINRSDRRTELFEARYLGAYGDLPSRAAFRGYDAVALFAGALFETGHSFSDRLGRVGDTPIGTPYRFLRTGGSDGFSGVSGGFGVSSSGGRYANDQWTLVSFTSDYHITAQ
jgi:hypothetical protein